MEGRNECAVSFLNHMAPRVLQSNSMLRPCRVPWPHGSQGTQSGSQQAQRAQRLTEAPHVGCLGQRAVLHNLRRHVRDCGAVGEEGRETVLSMQTRSSYTVAF